MIDIEDRAGSQWHRWDPHLHCPGTALNDQFGGTLAWEQFLGRIESSVPPIRALGITDYYNVELYKKVAESKLQGRLPSVDLILPNIEMRYGIGTDKGSPVNVHLLVSPNDADHVEQIYRFLRSLTFEAYKESFRCDRPDLIRLGRESDKTLGNEDAAFAAGVNQFKVSPDQLRAEWKKSAWVQDNVLIAVVAGSGDGTSGLQGDASLMTLRKEIERSAHIIFSPQEKQRDFWLGRGSVDIQKLTSDYGGCKPCIHGSDAHSVAEVGAPTLDRFCWIKGERTFESLRQACIEPEDRVIVRTNPPSGALPSQVIGSVSVSKAPWLTTSSIPLNSGLVAIIGARGSGKTALADIIASGGLALSAGDNDRSFVARARSYLQESVACLGWADGGSTSKSLVSPDYDGDFYSEQPRVRYLSQQFVDTLCSAEGVTDELLAEIERVIYQAHPIEGRLDTTTFEELLDLKTARGRAIRANNEDSLAELTNQLTLERERRAILPTLEKQRLERVASIEKDKRDRASLIAKGGEERTRQFDRVSSVAESIRSQVEQLRRRTYALQALRDEVSDTRVNRSPSRLRQMQQTYSEAGLVADQWKAFLLDFSGNVDRILAESIRDAELKMKAMSGPGLGEVNASSNAPPSPNSLIPLGASLEQQTLSLLDKEVARLQRLIGIDAEKAKLFARLSEKISRDEAALVKHDRELEFAKGAEKRIDELMESRRQSYASVFDGILKEEEELSKLYEPLKSRLQTEEGALNKLSFSIRRAVDLEEWCSRGEALLDLRKLGPFKGRGALLEAATTSLYSAWERGTSQDVTKAMSIFRDKHERDLMDHSLVDRSDAVSYRDWASRVSAWLYSTSHINVTYGLQYDGVEIEQLSPGTRGIVLLLLYLAIDREDDRPLLIDQPEENLDPKSIFDELVGRFRRAKLRRQIIIVTHNANLVVNADADQVIVADCGPHRLGQLPEISYQSGGLENPDIRQRVCEILEGGEAAFKERARRLRVRL